MSRLRVERGPPAYPPSGPHMNCGRAPRTSGTQIVISDRKKLDQATETGSSCTSWFERGYRNIVETGDEADPFLFLLNEVWDEGDTWGRKGNDGKGKVSDSGMGSKTINPLHLMLHLRHDVFSIPWANTRQPNEIVHRSESRDLIDLIEVQVFKRLNVGKQAAAWVLNRTHVRRNHWMEKRQGGLRSMRVKGRQARRLGHDDAEQELVLPGAGHWHGSCAGHCPRRHVRYPGGIMNGGIPPNWVCIVEGRAAQHQGA
ncbi:hypothetical protein B0H17DRAFT_1142038 [Mycena rosella]|uniref:Uncharacterized protein n=1 Tax=Mycena rosella TaxID=1033263 RepID=A0AAD7CYK3_MYCRO|nr:hypothetical protein B0H17DRAFT_1142038 [Mycena rosella]